MQNQKGFILPLVIVVVAIAVLGTGGYLAYQYYGDRNLNDTNLNEQNQPQNQNQDNQTAGVSTTIKPYEYIKDSFDMNNESFSVKTEGGELFTILVGENTNIYIKVDSTTNKVSFSDFASARNQGLKLIGINAMGDETIKGTLFNDGKNIEATEIFWFVQ